jgi:hypothetical protein
MASALMTVIVQPLMPGKPPYAVAVWITGERFALEMRELKTQQAACADVEGHERL